MEQIPPQHGSTLSPTTDDSSGTDEASYAPGANTHTGSARKRQSSDVIVGADARYPAGSGSAKEARLISRGSAQYQAARGASSALDLYELDDEDDEVLPVESGCVKKWLQRSRGRGPREPRSPVGVRIITNDEDELELRPLVMHTWLSFPPQGSIGGHAYYSMAELDVHAMDSVQIALAWARLHQHLLTGPTNPFKLIESLRYTAKGVRVVEIHFTDFHLALKGSSSGPLVALSLLQLMSECYYDETVIVTGELTLSGKINEVGDIGFKIRKDWVQWATHILVPAANMPEVEELTEMLGRRRLVRVKAEVTNMEDVLREMVLFKNGGESLRVYKPGSATVKLREQPHDLGVVEMFDLPYGCNAFDVEVCAYPGPDELFYTGNPSKKAFTGLVLARAWLSMHAKKVIARLRQVGLKEANMLVDFMERRYTPVHPCAAEAMVDGVIRPGSLTIHMNLTRVGVPKEYDMCGWAAVLAGISVMTGLKIPPKKLVMFPAPITECGGFFYQGPGLTAEFLERVRTEEYKLLALTRTAYNAAKQQGLFDATEEATSGLKIVAVNTVWQLVDLAFGPLEGGSEGEDGASDGQGEHSG